MLPRPQIPTSHSLSSPLPIPPHSALYRIQPTTRDPRLPPLQVAHPSQLPPHLTPPSLLHFHPDSMAPSTDADSSDFRSFCNYVPNEVKHRKRTSSAQLKVLEKIFKKETKPNAATRKQLAAQLDMPPRSVQVWFQNRRAKEKTKASKIAAASNNTAPAPPSGPGNTDPSADDTSPSPLSSEDQEGPESPDDSQDCGSPSGKDISVEICDRSSKASGPLDGREASFHMDAWHIEPPQNLSLLRQSDAHHLLSTRRPSLPVNIARSSGPSSHGPPSIDSIDPLTRRRSVDASLQRLAYNPYAPIARAKNSAIYGTRISGYSQGRHHHQVTDSPPYSPSGRSSAIPHSSSYPQELHSIDGHSPSVDYPPFRFASTGNISPSPSPLSPYGAARASLPLPDGQLYAFPVRHISPPIPGPLPMKDFHFGAASSSMASPAESESDSPDPAYGQSQRGDDWDPEDDASSYDPSLRFGSIASVGTSNSSNTSYYSEVGSCDEPGYHLEMRRGSATPGHFVNMMSDLDVNEEPRSGAVTETLPSPVPQHSSFTDQQKDSAAFDISMHEHSTSDHHSYSSPTLTISTGGSSAASGPTSASIPISRSSELTYALQDTSDKHTHGSPYLSHETSSLSKHVDVRHSSEPSHFYYNHRSHYQPQHSSHAAPVSSISLPTVQFEKFDFSPDFNQLSSTGHFHPSYSVPANIQYTATDHIYPSGGEEEHGLRHTTSFAHSPLCDVYTAPHSGSVDPSIISSSIENAFNGAETYVQYV